ncbi:MAG TPA: septal ring lytic transglycosylase RlpA family protein [Hanamia sp.]|nr:septal ring lytic transglycosylase RlpA family protein [Hanamia sp.]
MKNIFHLILVSILCFISNGIYAQKQKKSGHLKSHKEETAHEKSKVKYGTASYYAKKFHGQKTASGETHRDEIYTAACNVFPLHSRVKVTNLKNNRSVIVKINDRMHAKNKRLIDLSQSAAKYLRYVSAGVTKVRVELISDFEDSHAKRGK